MAVCTLRIPTTNPIDTLTHGLRLGAMKVRHGTPNFELILVRNTADGLGSHLQRE